MVRLYYWGLVFFVNSERRDALTFSPLIAKVTFYFRFPICLFSVVEFLLLKCTFSEKKIFRKILQNLPKDLIETSGTFL
ncbi:hypothetical protein HMPREF1869_00313 [Bacteroidales bacterium KA00251]|nr:hypothetical protein HMPREF1869_00313 [Bacteroidales bacterium KA00251]